MNEHNGNVPIIGQAKVNGWQLTLAITCGCGKVLLGAGLPGQIVAACDRCRVGYTIAELHAGQGQPVEIRMMRVHLQGETDGPNMG